jgi:hypothetical protein
MTRNSAIERAIAAIDEHAWTPVSYPGAVQDPDTGGWISDAEVAEIPYTAFASGKDWITARLVVRRVKDACYPDALFPVWRYHPFFTNTDLPVAEADITHRQHAIIETVFADLIDGPLAHLPSGRFGANSAWILCAAITHNLLRAAGILAATSTPGTGIDATPQDHQRSRPTGPATTPPGPAPAQSLALAPTMASTVVPHNPTPATTARDILTTPPKGPTGAHRKSWTDQPIPHARIPTIKINSPRPTQSGTSVDRGLGASKKVRRADSSPSMSTSAAMSSSDNTPAASPRTSDASALRTASSSRPSGLSTAMPWRRRYMQPAAATFSRGWVRSTVLCPLRHRDSSCRSGRSLLRSASTFHCVSWIITIIHEILAAWWTPPTPQNRLARSGSPRSSPIAAPVNRRRTPSRPTVRTSTRSRPC